MADDTDQHDDSEPTRLPIIRWLHNNATWLSAVGAIAAVMALVPVFFSSPETNVGNTVLIEGDNEGGQIAGGDITNIGDPQDKATIAWQQRTIDNLLSQLSASDQQANDQIRDEITDAVRGLPAIDSTPSQIEQAEAALAQGNTALAQALYKADAENKTAAGETQLQAAAQSYRRLGALAYLNDTAAALEAYQKAVEAWPDDIRAWNQLGHLYERTGQLEQAIEAYVTVGELADSTDEPQAWTAISLGSLGIVHQIRGELDDAVAMYEKALAINTELGRKQGMAANYGNLGTVHHTRGELDEAVAMHEKSLALNTELSRKEGMAANYGNLGIVHHTRGELDQAVAMHEKSLAIETELGRKEGMASDYGNLGVVHRIRGELDQAVAMHQNALALNTELGYKEGMASDYGNLGNVHQVRGEMDQAVAMYEKALAINTELGRKQGMASDYGNLGNVHKTRGELDQARQSWEQSVELFDAIGSPTADKVRSWIDELDVE